MNDQKSISTILKKPKKIQKNPNLINNIPEGPKISIRPLKIKINLQNSQKTLTKSKKS